jgi:hypothetical protein
MNDERVVDERALRASLRLEADERPPRLDVARLRAAAESRARLSLPLLLVGSFAFSILSVAAVATGLRLIVVAATFVASVDPVSAAVVAITRLAEQFDVVLAVATQPAVPIAILTCLVIAFYYERVHSHMEKTNA